MRILSIANVALSKSEGSGQIVLGIVRGLRNAGHQVALFGPDDYEAFRWMHPRARHYRLAIGMRHLVSEQLRSNRYDLVQIFGSEGWLALKYLRLRSKRKRPMCILFSNGLEPHAY